jgi:hypothetical protein
MDMPTSDAASSASLDVTVVPPGSVGESLPHPGRVIISSARVATHLRFRYRDDIGILQVERARRHDEPV